MTEVAFEQLPANIAEKVQALDTDVPQYVDYFAPADNKWVELPDGRQAVCLKVLAEGERRKYLNSTNQEFTMNARTKDLKMKSSAGDDLHALLKIAIVDWRVFRNGQPYDFQERRLSEALDAWPVSVVDHIADAVRDLNPWLKGDDDLEALVSERDALNERIDALKAAQAKN